MGSYYPTKVVTTLGPWLSDDLRVIIICITYPIIKTIKCITQLIDMDEAHNIITWLDSKHESQIAQVKHKVA
jgi:hypothetical protein